MKSSNYLNHMLHKSSKLNYNKKELIQSKETAGLKAKVNIKRTIVILLQYIIINPYLWMD